MATTLTNQSISSIQAIAAHLLIPLADPSAEHIEYASEAAFDAVVYSRELELLCLNDRRFTDRSFPHRSPDQNSNESPYSDFNAISLDKAFELGFDLALEIGARIAHDPLGEHDLSKIVANHRSLYLAEVAKRRSEASRELSRELLKFEAELRAKEETRMRIADLEKSIDALASKIEGRLEKV